jgi:hypothetical protein
MFFTAAEVDAQAVNMKITIDFSVSVDVVDILAELKTKHRGSEARAALVRR